MQTCVVRPLTKRVVSLLEIEAHDACRQPRAAVGDIAALRRGDSWIVERAKQMVEPAVVEHDVLVDLTDNRKTRGADARIQRRGGASAAAGDQAKIGQVERP